MKTLASVFHQLAAALLCGALLLAPAGCEKANWQPGQAIAAKDLRIGVLYLTDPDKETSGFTYEHHAGIRSMQKTLGIADAQIVIKRSIPDTNPNGTGHHLRELAASGVNVIFAVSAGYADACARVAAEYPNVIFTTLGGNEHNARNLTNYYGAIHQARYLSGIVAGLQTKTDKIGYVAAMGMEDSQVTSGLNAFAIGVESVNPAAQILVHVTHNWFDPANEALATRLLIKHGSDIVTHHTDTPTPIREAQKAGVPGIGYNSDMRREAPETVLTSAIWHWNVYYTVLTQSVIDGTFTTAPYFGGIRDRLIGLAPLNEKLVASETAAAVEKAATRIRNGEFDVFDGIMETNDGRKIGRNGGRLTAQEIGQNMTWYYRNIVALQSAR
ncbi:MAG: BMP family ABC transporter substrate-binding protein [Candidatus Accumulibacter sp.]|nr:BMP family ABC transporter substrate-binding protein [Accumulibacter sp.]